MPRYLTHIAGVLGRSTPHFRGKQRLGRSILRGCAVANIHGVTLDLDLSDTIQRDVFFGCYEPVETSIIRRILTPGAHFVDVGANIGYYTALGSYLVGPSGKVTAFEPDAVLAKALSSATRNISCVSVHPFGLGKETATVPLFIPPISANNRDPSMLKYRSDMMEVSVEVRRLDDIIKERVSLLKIDVEGHEMDVLLGAQALLKEHAIDAIICEFNQELQTMAGSSSQELLEYIKSFGYIDTNTKPLTRFENRLLVSPKF